MNKPKPGALFIQAWVGSEGSGTVRRPSWMARKGMSTRPPVPTVAPTPSIPVAAEPNEQPAAVVSMPQPPPPAAVHIATSMALAQVSDENAALRAQIIEMAATMARLRREVLAASEGELVKLALTVAERVVGHELTTDPTLVVAWAREAVESLAAKDGVVIAVARDVRDDVPASAWSEVGVEHRVQTDALLARGVVEVRTPEGTVATGADARLAAVAQALGVGEP
ncbi:MAG TPA: FliH/SctL family protein [Polyangiaceae bacterium]|nr:FliH/SctL family protein [Polyangiaceae bacterium]